MTKLKLPLFFLFVMLTAMGCGGANSTTETTGTNSQNPDSVGISGNISHNQQGAENAGALGDTSQAFAQNSNNATTAANTVAGAPNASTNPNKMEAAATTNAKVVELPDGTKVILNRSSQAAYEEAADEVEKKIVLKGEAYFEVKPATIKVKKFNVYAGNTRTTVVGTKFNLRAYDNQNVIVLEVLEGEVEFVVLTTQNRQMVKAGERVIYTRDKQTVQKEKITGEDFKWWLKTTPVQGSGENKAPKPTSAECASQFVSNSNIGGQRNIQTVSILLVARTTEDYSIDFIATKNNTQGRITTTSQMPLEKDDKLMLIAENDEKLVFTFVLNGEKKTVQGRASYSNNFEIDAENLRWLTNNKIKQIRIVKTVDMKMYPYTLGGDRQSQLSKLAQCFLWAVE